MIYPIFHFIDFTSRRCATRDFHCYHTPSLPIWTTSS